MHIITRRRLQDFGAFHVEAVDLLNAWYHTFRKATYATPAELKADFASASFLANERVVFNIGGNKYRLIADVRYEWQRVYIVGVYTHAEYDRL